MPITTPCRSSPPENGLQWTTYAERLRESRRELARLRQLCQRLNEIRWATSPSSAWPTRRCRRRTASSHRPTPSCSRHMIRRTLLRSLLIKGFANTMPAKTQAEETSSHFLSTSASDVREGRAAGGVVDLAPPEANSEHPSSGSPIQGAWFIQQILDALTAVPEVWSKTVFLVNYDENDGFFDHIPSPSRALAEGRWHAMPASPRCRAADMAFEYYTPSQSSEPQEPACPGRPRLRPRPARADVGDLAVEPGRLGELADLRPHLGDPLPREARFGAKEPQHQLRGGAPSAVTSPAAFNFANPNGEPLPTLAGRQTKAGGRQSLLLRNRQLPQVAQPADPMDCQYRRPACVPRAHCRMSCTPARARRR